MLNKFLSKVFDSNDREVKKLMPIVSEINSLEDQIKKLKDSDFPKKTLEFKKRIKEGEDIYLLLPEVFAIAREAAKRSIGQRHFDVQLMAAITLAQGKITEQKTGEGKTLSAVPALYLHALTGKPVHLVTVNDYLARRDGGWMGSVFSFLGMSTSSIISEASFIYDKEFVDEQAKDYRLVHLKSVSRKEAYSADIVYGINSEFGFDYLRDNMVFEQREFVQRGYYFAVIDEVDSVLIDEARTPHIISMPDSTPSQKYYEYSKVVEKLSGDTDYKLDEKSRTAHLTDNGIEKIEKMFGVKDIYEKDFDTVYHIEAALKAKTLFLKDRDYIVRDNQVILVDEFTGRLMEGRRLSEGLHQAIEAKENVAVQQESKTLATVSLQNYFRMYKILAGMTGTAVTEAEEFQKIYKLDVVAVPTNRSMARADEGDLVFKTIAGKIGAIADEIEQANKKGQPILVGTTSIDKNEIISEALKKRGIKHEVLNAKNHMREALIIKEAGRKHAVTVATNMAGRGVDIILGGQPPSEFEQEYQSESGKKRYQKEQTAWEKEHEEVIGAGGLLVIGTEKHESRRIDNQLRGRSGRQGDPGRSIFIISLEDDLMRVFGGEQISNLMTRFNFPEDQPLSHGLVSRVIEQAQVKVEGMNFDIRKNLLDYDDVLNKQREIIYNLRKKIVLNEENSTVFVKEKIRTSIEGLVAVNLNKETGSDHKSLVTEFATIIPFDDLSQDQLFKQVEQIHEEKELAEFLSSLANQLIDKWIEEHGVDKVERVFKILSLSSIDNLWMDHLTAIEDLRTGIGLRGYAQQNPLIAYKNESFKMFEQLIASIDDTLVHRVFRVNFADIHLPDEKPQEDMILNQSEEEVSESARKHSHTHTHSHSSSNTDSSQKIKTASGKKLGRNDPCWCGSGKKWKKCHYPQLA